MTRKTRTRRALLNSVISLMLCFVMLLGTTFAWFTDTVTSSNNIIKSGTLDVELQYKAKAADDWKDASTGAIFNYEYWEPGYVDSKYVQIVNNGNLALKYRLDVIPAMQVAAGDKNLADVIDVYMFPAGTTVDRATIAATTPVGTLSTLMADADGAAYGVLLPTNGSADVKLNPEDAAIAKTGSESVIIALKMQESAGNEYQDLEVGGGSFKVQLLATQYTYENDSFDNMYDEDAEYTDVPVASVDKVDESNLPQGVPLWSLFPSITNLNRLSTPLIAGYTFKATETAAEAEVSPYKNWHADFVVSFDKPVATGTAGIAGQYDFWSLDWLGFEAFDVDSADAVDGIPANKAFRLLESFVTVNYLELCRDVQTFTCGVFKNDETNKGTTMTVELRLYEIDETASDKSSTDCETGNYITIGTYSYTF